MTIETIRVTLTGIERTASTAGDPAIRVSCNFDDGSTWDDGRPKGKRVTDWLNWDTAPDDIFKRWAYLAEPNCDIKRAREILAGEDWRLIGMDVVLDVDKSGNYGWDVRRVHALASSTSTSTNVNDDEIPF